MTSTAKTGIGTVDLLRSTQLAEDACPSKMFKLIRTFDALTRSVSTSFHYVGALPAGYVVDEMVVHIDSAATSGLLIKVGIADAGVTIVPQTDIGALKALVYIRLPVIHTEVQPVYSEAKNIYINLSAQDGIILGSWIILKKVMF